MEEVGEGRRRLDRGCVRVEGVGEGRRRLDGGGRREGAWSMHKDVCVRSVCVLAERVTL